MKQDESDALIDMAYDCLDGNEDVMAYHEKHGIPSLLIMTQTSQRIAKEMARLLPIEGKRVIEIGAGVGYLAVEMAKRCESVIAIEVDPAWSWVFTRCLYVTKPTNLTWIFGSAETMIGKIDADIAIIMTRSGVTELRELASQFAPEVLMPFQDLTMPVDLIE